MIESRNFTSIETAPYKHYIDIGMFKLAASSGYILSTSTPIDYAGVELGAEQNPGRRTERTDSESTESAPPSVPWLSLSQNLDICPEELLGCDSYGFVAMRWADWEARFACSAAQDSCEYPCCVHLASQVMNT